MTVLRKELIELTEILPEEKILEVLQFIKEKILIEKKSAFGILSKYADKNLISQEKSAWESEVVKKYENFNWCKCNFAIFTELCLKNVKKSAEIINAGALTLPEVIAEVIYVLKSVYKVERKEISTAILKILEEIEVEHKNIVIEAVKIFAEKNLDFVDCILIAYSRIENFEIFSFDKKLNNNLNK